MAERDQLSYAYSYSCLVSFFTVFQVVAKDSMRPFVSYPQSRFQSESECAILVFLCSLILISRRMKTDIRKKDFLQTRFDLEVRLW